MSKKLLVIIALLALLPFSALAATPKEYAESIAANVIDIIESGKSESTVEQELVQLFKKNVDSDWMAGFTMGKYYRQLSPEQKKKYNELYRDYVIYSYIPKFRLYTSERMNVIQAIQDDKDFYTVKTSLNTKKSSTGKVFVDYKLKKSGSSFKIIDVVGEGVSLINTQRSDFSTPLSEGGVESFLTRLEAKVVALKANPPTEAKKGDEKKFSAGKK